MIIKYIGIVLACAGLILTALVFYLGRKNGIREKEAELQLIQSSGYASSHVAAKAEPSVYDETPVKVPPRKRSLSREAEEILKKVEEERCAEKEADPETSFGKGVYDNMDEINDPQPKKTARGTDILFNGSDQKKPKGTDVLPSDSKGTGSERRPDILTDPQGRHAPKGTDILPENKASAGKRVTDILPAAKKDRKGAAILPDKDQKDRRGTDVLLPNTGATDILQKRPKGTDHLAEKPGRRGTDILPIASGEENK